MFFEPRIPPNTGNAIRMVAGTGATLHLVEPLGFDLSEPKLGRAGLDYHDLASVVVHPDLDTALASPDLARSRVFALTSNATRWFTDVALGRATSCSSGRNRRVCRTTSWRTSGSPTACGSPWWRAAGR